MTMQTVDAVFERGVFKPISQSAGCFVEGQRVRLTVETPGSPDEILQLAANVYAGLSAAEVTDIERIILDRRDFFGGRSPS
jgi:predicted DNA-binding antitoxin AbrB/MazE fold protein